jgi:hypothetical protein
MASINDVFNRLGVVNNSLGWIYTETVAEVTATGKVQASVNTLDGDVKAGTTATVNALTTLDNDVKAGLKVLAEIELAAVDLLFHLTQQADTMICELGQISKNTCGILTQVTLQTDLQQGLSKDVAVLLDIEEAVHPEASLQLQRLLELRARIEKCCPPRPPEPACTYKPCPAPPSIGRPETPPVVGQPTGTVNSQ